MSVVVAAGCRGVLLLVALCATPTLQASGLGLDVHGARLQGSANSATAIWSDASALAVSPAASSTLSGFHASVDVHHGVATSRFVVSDATDGAGDALTPVPQTVTLDNRGWWPQVYLTSDLAPAWTAGLAITVPFGSDVWLDDTFTGRLYGTGLRLSSLQATPSIAWQFSRRHVLGAGLSWQWLEAETLRHYSLNGLSAGQIASPRDASVLTRGEDEGLGLRWGYAWTPDDTTRLALTWRSAIKHRLEGAAAFDVPDDAAWQLALSVSEELRDGVASSTGWVDVTTPESLSLALMRRLTPAWVLSADVTWTRNSRVDEVRLSIPTAEDPQRNVTLALDWRDTWKASLGADYQWSEAWTLRTGLMFDHGPVRDAAHSLPALADTDRAWLAVGASLHVDATRRLDVSLASVRVEPGNFHRTDDDGVAANGTPGILRGSADTHGWLAGVQYNQRWP